MAQKATVYRAQLSISDLDRHYYADHTLTLARHPSESEGRLMARLLAYALFAAPDLAFGRGISTDDEPDLWRRDPTGSILHWIEVGLPDERRLRRAAGRSERVSLVAYGARAFALWHARQRDDLARLDRLDIRLLDDAQFETLEGFARRTMNLTCTIQEGIVWLGDGDRTAAIELVTVTAAD
ncbi:MAG: YaeQ family protein [Pseudomonadales bacterium]|nr:YaeQ family protein [Pseudomonadales bacterium]